MYFPIDFFSKTLIVACLLKSDFFFQFLSKTHLTRILSSNKFLLQSPCDDSISVGFFIPIFSEAPKIIDFPKKCPISWFTQNFPKMSQNIPKCPKISKIISKCPKCPNEISPISFKESKEMAKSSQKCKFTLQIFLSLDQNVSFQIDSSSTSFQIFNFLIVCVYGSAIP